MDNQTNDTQVYHSECVTDSGSVLTHGRWEVRELVLTVEKLRWIWQEVQRYKSLFSDFTIADSQNFYSLISHPDTFWLEVVDMETQELTGLIYLTEMSQIIDYGVHIIFFDRKPSEKVALCRAVAKWFFHRFPCQRLTATIAGNYHATLRLVEKIGFTFEGKKRKSQLMNHRWVDEHIFGLLREEI